jgi:hypothetical protein
VQLSGSHGSRISMGGIRLLSGTACPVLLKNGLSDTLAIIRRNLMGLYGVTSVGGFPVSKS